MLPQDPVLDEFRQSPLYRKLRDRQCLDEQTTAAQLLAITEQISTNNQALTKVHQKLLTAMVIAIVVFGLFAFFIVLPSMNGPLGLLALLLLAGIIGLNVYRLQWRPCKINAERIETAQNLLLLLSRDTATDADLRLLLDFKHPTHISKKGQTEPDPNRSGWKLTHFADNWLILEGPFLDGTQFSLKLTGIHIQKAGWKRGSSGKRKYKTKEKFKGTHFELTLQIPRKRYGAVSILKDDIASAIRLRPYAQLKRLKVSDRSLSMLVKLPISSPKPEVLSETVMTMLLSCYQVLNLARSLSKPSASP